MQRGGSNNDFVVPNAQAETISSIGFSANGTLFTAGSWTSEVRLWRVQGSAVVPTAETKLKSPVLCTEFSPDGTAVFAGGCDNTVTMWSVANNQTRPVAQHQQPVRAIKYCPQLNSLVSCSWDKTVKYWDLRTNQCNATIPLPERAYCMDLRGSNMVVGTADRHVLAFDLRRPQQPLVSTRSALRFQSRCIALFPDASGYALGSLEGRVSIAHINAAERGKDFCFKCHRLQSDVYAVNSISFHPTTGKFATAGSDGVCIFWDKDRRHRLKLFNQNGSPITATAFNHNGSIFAYAIGYDWSKGLNHYRRDKPNQIYFRPVQHEDLNPRKR